MTKIRNIKPEFSTSEQVIQVSRDARLLFLLLQNQCDDNGITPDSRIGLRLKIFPGDPITQPEFNGWLEELIKVEMVSTYEVDKKAYLILNGWDDKKSDFFQGFIKNFNAKYPLPPWKTPKENSTSDQNLPKRSPEELLEDSLSTPEGVLEKEKEKEKEKEIVINNNSSLRSELFVNADVVDVHESPPEVIDRLSKPKKKPPDVPHNEVIGLYHQHLPMLPAVNVEKYFGKDSRRRNFERRWQEHPEIGWWDDFFQAVSMSDWLTGRESGWKASFGWLILPRNFVKVIEGNYVNVRVKHEKTQRNVQQRSSNSHEDFWRAHQGISITAKASESS